MYKVSHFLGEDQFGPRVIPLFGPADSYFEKTAAATLLTPVVRYIESLKPTNGSQYVLVNAMGATEYYGSNINGDAFSEASLIHRPDDWRDDPVLDRIRGKEWPYGFPTFYDAHPFAHHRNKDPKRAFGEVELAAWNDHMHRVELVCRIDKDKCEQFGGVPVWDRISAGQFPDVSMGCFPAGSLVTMVDGTRRPIEDVVDGDVVLTHRGRGRRVTALHRRHYSGELYTIKFEAHRTLRCTRQHPLYVVSEDEVKERDDHANLRWCTDQKIHPDWVHAECLRITHYGLAPVPYEERLFDMPYDRASAFARLLGYYLAEGHLLRNKSGKLCGIELTTNKNDPIHDEIDNLCRVFGTKNMPSSHGRVNSEEAIGIYIFDEHLARLCSEHAGSYSDKKRLSETVMFWPKDLQFQLLGAYANGDGCGPDEGSLKFSTASVDLSWQLMVLLARKGIPASHSVLRHKDTGRSSKDTTEYVVHVGKQWSSAFSIVCAKVKSSEVLKSKHSRIFALQHNTNDMFVVTPVRDIVSMPVEMDVFNLEVEEDESYVVEGLAVHNCKVPFDTCFPAGTLVRTETGNKPIEQVVVGEKVLADGGLYLPVTAVMRRQADDLMQIVASGLPEITPTSNHPFLIVRREEVRACKGTANGRRCRHTPDKSNTMLCRRCGAELRFSMTWTAASEVRPGDYMVVPAQTPSSRVDIALPRARMLGYYLGDGYIIKQRTGKKKDGEYRDMGVGFSVGSSEQEHLRRLLGTLAEAGLQNEPGVYDAGCERKAHIVSVYDQEAAVWLQEMGGRGSYGKRLAEDVFDWPLEAKLELVGGYIDTDGSFDDKGQVRIASVNRGLLLDVQRLLLQERITATVCFAGTSSGYEGGSDCWYLVLSATQAQRFLGRSVKVEPRELVWESPQSFFWEGYWLTPVKSVEELDVEREVYNLSVDKLEQYVAEGRVVHNCSICLDWKLYREAAATFDKAKHKHPGMAILEFHKKLKEKNGTGIRGLSITRKDYCEHAAKQMNRILKDGRKVWVYNDYPRFFDISFVFIGADKTAKMMLKIAEGGVVYSIPSAKVAEDMGYTELWHPESSTRERMEKAASAEDEWLKMAFLGKNARLAKRSEIVKDVVPDYYKGKAVELATSNEKDLPKDLLDSVATSSPLENILSTSGSLGMVLRPREFQRIVLVQIGRKDMADDLDKKNITFPKTDEKSEVPMGPQFFSKLLAGLLRPFFEGRSALAPALEGRLVMSTDKDENKKTKTSSQESELLHKIGSAYNGYRSSLMDLVAHAQPMIGSATDPSDDLHKVASSPVDEVFTPLSVAYLQEAFWNEVPVSGNGVKTA